MLTISNLPDGRIAVDRDGVLLAILPDSDAAWLYVIRLIS